MSLMSATDVEVVHLQRGCELELVRRFYTELLVPTFEPEELDPWSEWVEMLDGGDECGGDGTGTGTVLGRCPGSGSVPAPHVTGQAMAATAATSGWVVDRSYPFSIDFHVFVAVRRHAKCDGGGGGAAALNDPSTGDAHAATSIHSTPMPPIDPKTCELLGGASCEEYKTSGTTLLAYIVTAPAARRKGVGRALLGHVRDVAGAGLLTVETASLSKTDPAACSDGRDRMANIAAVDRLKMYAHWGFVGPADLPFTCPAHAVGGRPIRGYLLQIHRDATDDRGRVPRQKIAAFCLEYYAACFTADDDLGVLQAILEWAEAAEFTDCVPPLSLVT
jgi:GNAT superfamily N-acetyltransferase